jgi:hypothetical protein
MGGTIKSIIYLLILLLAFKAIAILCPFRVFG